MHFSNLRKRLPKNYWIDSLTILLFFNTGCLDHQDHPNFAQPDSSLRLYEKHTMNYNCTTYSFQVKCERRSMATYPVLNFFLHEHRYFHKFSKEDVQNVPAYIKTFRLSLRNGWLHTLQQNSVHKITNSVNTTNEITFSSNSLWLDVFPRECLDMGGGISICKHITFPIKFFLASDITSHFFFRILFKNYGAYRYNSLGNFSVLQAMDLAVQCLGSLDHIPCIIMLRVKEVFFFSYQKTVLFFK